MFIGRRSQLNNRRLPKEKLQPSNLKANRNSTNIMKMKKRSISMNKILPPVADAKVTMKAQTS